MSSDKDLDLPDVGNLTPDELQALATPTDTALDQLLEKVRMQQLPGTHVSMFNN